ncbi:putative epoxide hydrolase [Trichoderma barbatum]
MYSPIANPLTVFFFTLSLSSVISDFDNSHTKYHPRPFKINVSPTLINDNRSRAGHYCHVPDIAAPPWFDGPPSTNVFEVAIYIASDYDWFQFQDAVNRNFSHFITLIATPSGSYPDDQIIYFIHQQSEREDAIPIILLHGWPSTSLEWAKPAFHVVAPDLSRYGFSPAPIAPGLGGAEHATLLNVLFTNATDIERYAKNQTTAEESSYISFLNSYMTTHAAYAQIHSSFPLSIAYALTDSPVGFLTWMWKIDFTVRDLSAPFEMEELVSQALTLFIPGVYGNIRSYKELFPEVVQGFRLSKVPTSPDLRNYNFVPRDWVERTANVTFFRRHNNGGHFPAYS